MVSGGTPRALGIDIGGTHSRARLVAGQAVLAEAQGRSASVAAQGPEQALAALNELLGQLRLDADGPVAAVCAGAAGMLKGEALVRFQRRLAEVTDGGPVLVVGDGALVLPAANLEDGVGVICGTGTVAFARWGERSATAGGWGFLLGDDGSGYWVVRRAIRALLDRSDRARPPGPLGADLLRAAGASDAVALRDLVYQDPRPGRWAGLAPVVLASSDPEVGDILEEAAAALDSLVAAVLEPLGEPVGLPIVLAGGVTGNDRYRRAVAEHLHRARPASTVSVLAEPPVAGAVRLAQRALAARGV